MGDTLRDSCKVFTYPNLLAPQILGNEVNAFTSRQDAVTQSRPALPLQVPEKPDKLPKTYVWRY